MTYPTDPRVDAYIDALPAWQQAIYRQVRDLVHAADPGVTETIKRTTRPCFVLNGNICALQAAKDHVNVSSTTAPSSPTLRASSPAGMTTRPPVRWPSATARPSTRPLTAVVRQIIADNRAGGWRKLKRAT